LGHKTPKLQVFVETGTFRGDMLERVGDHFRVIYSIELDKGLYEKALKRFQGRGHVRLLCGNSALEIKRVLAELNEPALFWLDAHGSGALTVMDPLHCPAGKELEAILAHHVKGHV